MKTEIKLEPKISVEDIPAGKLQEAMTRIRDNLYRMGPHGESNTPFDLEMAKNMRNQHGVFDELYKIMEGLEILPVPKMYVAPELEEDKEAPQPVDGDGPFILVYASRINDDLIAARPCAWVAIDSCEVDWVVEETGDVLLMQVGLDNKFELPRTQRGQATLTELMNRLNQARKSSRDSRE